MLEQLGQIKEFNTAFNCAVDTVFPVDHVGEKADLLGLRIGLNLEEVDELTDACIDYCSSPTPENLAHVFKEYGDLLYVVLGFGITWGFPTEEIFDVVHSSNMSKLDLDGKPTLREDGKILKGPAYQEPDLLPLVYEYLGIS